MLGKLTTIAAVLALATLLATPLVMAQQEEAAVSPDVNTAALPPGPPVPYVVGTDQYGRAIYTARGSPDCWVHIGGPSGPEQLVSCPVDATTMGGGSGSTDTGMQQYANDYCSKTVDYCVMVGKLGH